MSSKSLLSRHFGRSTPLTHVIQMEYGISYQIVNVVSKSNRNVMTAYLCLLYAEPWNAMSFNQFPTLDRGSINYICCQYS